MTRAGRRAGWSHGDHRHDQSGMSPARSTATCAPA